MCEDSGQDDRIERCSFLFSGRSPCECSDTRWRRQRLRAPFPPCVTKAVWLFAEAARWSCGGSVEAAGDSGLRGAHVLLVLLGIVVIDLHRYRPIHGRIFADNIAGGNGTTISDKIIASLVISRETDDAKSAATAARRPTMTTSVIVAGRLMGCSSMLLLSNLRRRCGPTLSGMFLVITDVTGNEERSASLIRAVMPTSLHCRTRVWVWTHLLVMYLHFPFMTMAPLPEIADQVHDARRVTDPLLDFSPCRLLLL